MDCSFKPAAAALILIVGFAGSSAGAGAFEDGLDAARRADYATVLRLWRPLAEQGDARVQSNLALMYEPKSGSWRPAAVWQIADIMRYGQETRGFAAATGG